EARWLPLPHWDRAAWHWDRLCSRERHPLVCWSCPMSPPSALVLARALARERDPVGVGSGTDSIARRSTDRVGTAPVAAPCWLAFRRHHIPGSAQRRRSR